MTQSNFSVIVLAAGMGTRMKSDIPKALHKVAGREMVAHVVDAFSQSNPDHIVVVKAEEDMLMDSVVAPHKTVVQKERLGTGHAAKTGMQAIPADYKGNIIVTVADMPLITAETVANLVDSINQDGIGVSVLAFRPEDPLRYGRLITTTYGQLIKIVEYKDATEIERKVNLCNSGVIAIDGNKAREWLDRINNDNAAGEYYLTDIVAIGLADKYKATFVEASEEEVSAANTRAELSYLEDLMQNRLRERAMLNGVTMLEPSTVYLSWDTDLTKDVILEPGVFFGTGVTVEEGAHIRAFSHLSDCVIRKNAIIGPFARLRDGSEIGQGTKIGNFVEIDTATVGEKTKIYHLSYIGNASVGSQTNLGAGVITCNYDGFFKHKAHIGDNAFIGTNTVLIAPVTVGDGAYTAAGTVITKNVEADALAVSRPVFKLFSGWAAAYRKRMQKKKDSQAL